jgi:hypothetical protein
MTASAPAAASGRRRQVLFLAGVALGLTLLTAARHTDALRAGGIGVFRQISHHLERSDQLLHAWTLDWLYYQAPRDPRALFHANAFHPHPASLALSDHLVGVAVTLLPLRAVVEDPLRLNAIGTLLSFVAAGTAVAALVVTLTGSMVAGWVAGALYAFNPFRLHNFAQIQLLSDYGLPLGFLLLHRYARDARARDLVGLAAVVAWQTLASAYLGAYLAVVLGLVLAWHMWRAPRLRPRPATLAVAAGVGAALLAPFLLPYLRLRALGQLHQHEINSIALSIGLAEFVCVRDCGSFFGLTLVPVTLALASAGVVMTRARGAGVYLVVAALGALMALGPYIHVSAITDLGAAPGFLAPGPYWVLQRWAPAFDGLRAPARAIALTHFALAVLAGFGAARLVALGRRPGHRTALGAIALVAATAAAAFARPRPPFEPLAGLRETPAVYRDLAAESGSAPIVEIPARLYDDVIMYHSRVHRRPIVNGYSGFLPFGHRYAIAALRCYPCPTALRTLADLDVHTHLVHLNLLPDAARATMEARIAATPSLRVVRRIGDTLLVAFTPDAASTPAASAPADQVRLPRGDWGADSSLGPDGVARALDDSYETAWSTGIALEALASPVGGLALLRRAPTWRAFLDLVPRGPAWFSIDLGAAQTVRRLAIGYTDHAGPAAPAAPSVEGSLDGVTWFPLSAEPTVRPSLRAFDEDPTRARLEYEWAPITLRHLRLRQRGFWFLHDVEAFA